MRKIIHIDMDCFYASVEMRERPELAGKPIAVGGSSGRSVLTTCNYEARRFGCRSAMPTYKAKQLCPDLIVLPVRFELYREASKKVRAILESYTPLVEPLSLDEAYLDVSELERFAWDVAKEIRGSIFEETGLTASAGIASNKLLAKIASDWKKPNGQFAVVPDAVLAFMKDLSVKKIWGVGPKSVEKLRGLGVETCGQLQNLNAQELTFHFGSFGSELYDLCRGIDSRPVEPFHVRKSLSNEHTFEEDLVTLEACEEKLRFCFDELLDDLSKKRIERPIAKLFVKLKFSDFKRTTKECIFKVPDFSVYRRLLKEAFERSGQGVRLIGLGVRFHEGEKRVIDQLELEF